MIWLCYTSRENSLQILDQFSDLHQPWMRDEMKKNWRKRGNDEKGEQAKQGRWGKDQGEERMRETEWKVNVDLQSPSAIFLNISNKASMVERSQISWSLVMHSNVLYFTSLLLPFVSFWSIDQLFHRFISSICASSHQPVGPSAPQSVSQWVICASFYAFSVSTDCSRP